MRLSFDRGARIGVRLRGRARSIDEAAAIAVPDINLCTGSGARILRVSKPRHRSEVAIPAVVDELSRRNGVAGVERRSLG